jgi:hypothetical protein
MLTESSLPCSQEPAVGPTPKTVGISALQPALLAEIFGSCAQPLQVNVRLVPQIVTLRPSIFFRIHKY